jgi:hypothetical protein
MKGFIWFSLALFGLCHLCHVPIGVVLIYFAPSTRLGYVVRYGADFSHVVIERRPHNCEWGSAPLGDKHCDYKAEAHTVRTDRSKDHRPIMSFDEGKTWFYTGISTTGRPIVSYDEGKTWFLNTEPQPRVTVSWVKIDE